MLEATQRPFAVYFNKKHMEQLRWPGRSIVMSVSVCVFVSVGEHIFPDLCVRSPPFFACYMAVVRSVLLAGGVEITLYFQFYG